MDYEFIKILDQQATCSTARTTRQTASVRARLHISLQASRNSSSNSGEIGAVVVTMSVHYAAWAVSYFMACMTTVVASEVRSITYITTRHFTKSGFDEWSASVSTVSPALGCARECARYSKCHQFQWQGDHCRANANACHASCAVRLTKDANQP